MTERRAPLILVVLTVLLLGVSKVLLPQSFRARNPGVQGNHRAATQALGLQRTSFHRLLNTIGLS
jgi:hypothetical protein